MSFPRKIGREIAFRRPGPLRWASAQFESTSSSVKINGHGSTFTASTPLDFSDGRAVYAHKATPDLIRAYVVLRLCGFRSLVDHAGSLLAAAEKVFGHKFVKTFLRRTFFGHFCAGESENGIRPTVEALDRAGVGSILDYAAEVTIANL